MHFSTSANKHTPSTRMYSVVDIVENLENRLIVFLYLIVRSATVLSLYYSGAIAIAAME